MGRHRIGSEQAMAARQTLSAVMRGHTLDAVDIRILQALQVKGRATNVELAELAGVTPPPALRRTKTLEERGLIRGYHARLNAKKLGLEVTAFIAVGLASQADHTVKAFEALMQTRPNVRECHALSGTRDFLLKCVFHDLADANAFVTTVLLKTTNVATVNTAFAIAMTKDEAGVPLALVEAPPPAAAARKLKLPPLPRHA